MANIDWLTIFLFIVLVVFGWMNIYAVNFTDEVDGFFSLRNRYTMQLLWIGICIILGIIILLIDSRFYSFVAYPVFGLSILLLLAVVLIGKEINGAKSWIVMGPISLQPSELAKVATILALAKFLSDNSIKAKSIHNISIALGIIFLSPLLIMLQPDFGSTLVYMSLLLVLFREGLPGWVLIVLVCLSTLFILSLVFPILHICIALSLMAVIAYLIIHKNLSHIFFAILIFAAFLGAFLTLKNTEILVTTNFVLFFLSLVSSTIVYLIISASKKLKGSFMVILVLFGLIGAVYSVDFVFHEVLAQHQQDRVEVMLGLKSDPWGYEYNVNQSKIAIGSGGFSGKGYLRGTQTKLKFVPEQSTDFIFCTVGEEWGFLGSSALVLLFVGLLWRIIAIAERQRSKFSRIYAYGVVSIIFFHFAVNIAMTIALFPVIGIPLPFLSYGGSSLLAFSIMLFILLKLDATRKAYLI